MDELLTLYHGSENIIKAPEFGKGKPYCDYGLGFYTTQDKNLAGEWATLATGHSGFINEYTFDTQGLSSLTLVDSYSWIAVLMNNRKGKYKQHAIASRIARFCDLYLRDLSSYDYISGFRADDAYFSFVEDFMLGLLSVERLEKAMTFGDLGHQICCKSKEAFARLQFCTAYEAPSEKYYANAMSRDKKARAEYFALVDSQDASRGTLIFDLIAGGRGHGRI
jgi:hypothetical protein